jgi:hypothetical protein
MRQAQPRWRSALKKQIISNLEITSSGLPEVAQSVPELTVKP